MTLRIYANPYDITAQGFYFSSIEEFENQYKNHLPFEEYELEYIDGNDAECAIFNAMSVSQANLEEYFELLANLGDDEQIQISLCYLLENHIANNAADAVEQASEVSLFEGSLKDYAWDYLESCVFNANTPEIFRNYFDVDAFARDLELGGDVASYTWCDRHFVVTGP